MQRKIHVGSTSNTTEIFLLDTSSTVGGVLSNLAFNSAGLTCNYHRQGSAVGVSVALASGTIGAFTSGGLVSLDTIGMSGHYEIGIPDLACASGAKYVTVNFKGATNMAPTSIFIELDKVDYNNDQNFGLYNMQVNIGNSGITTNSYTKLSELTSMPTLPNDPLTLLTWIFERSSNKGTTTALLDTIFKQNGTTPLASSILTDDNVTFTRNLYA